MLRTILLCSILHACAGCAIFDADNRRTLNALDRHLAPESSAARWALAPAGLPLGLLAGAADLVVVHPVSVVDDAWKDTVELCWTPRDESRFRRAVLLPLAILGTPVIFTGDWLGRALFDIPPHADDQ